ncbi:hypothetical protein [Deinococcus multiflagellatus]|uniref:Uncharacterized protein n=1 Tax=Deinococcus multiflagellatus TaxID=1656887 RepID=A0ABW1ZPL7_9DEIO
MRFTGAAFAVLLAGELPGTGEPFAAPIERGGHERWAQNDERPIRRPHDARRHPPAVLPRLSAPLHDATPIESLKNSKLNNIRIISSERQR